jgi:hypothetical protein
VAARLRGAGEGHAMTGVLVTVRPGPVLHLWQDGREAARVPLDTPAALELAAAWQALCAAPMSPTREGAKPATGQLAGSTEALSAGAGGNRRVAGGQKLRA